VFKIFVEDGLIKDLDDKAFNDYLLSLSGECEMIVRKKKKKRSNKENRYYWGIVIKMISDYTGFSEDEAHDSMRMLFLKDRSGKVETIKSSKDLSTVEFEEYLSKIRMFASKELSLYIPDPNQTII